MRNARILTVALAVAALAMLLLSGPGTRAGWWEWPFGLSLLKYAVYVGAAAAIASLVLIVLLAVPKWRTRPWLPLLALCIALVAVAPPLILLGRAKAVPPIHDITTDLENPPAFEAIVPLRADAPNTLDRSPLLVTQQRDGYPDLAPVTLSVPPTQAYDRALAVAQDEGWEIVTADRGSGRIEATDTTFWFGFKDDIVVRLTPWGAGTRVDVRSVSRVGRSDVGTNARRIRTFLAALQR